MTQLLLAKRMLYGLQGALQTEDQSSLSESKWSATRSAHNVLVCTGDVDSTAPWGSLSELWLYSEKQEGPGRFEQRGDVI